MTGHPHSKKSMQAVGSLVLALAVLGVITTLGYTKTFNSNDTVSYMIALTTVVGVTGVGVLVSAIPNGALLIHAVFTLGLLAATIILVVQHIFTANDIRPLMALVLGGAATGAGIHSMTNVVNAFPVPGAMVPPPDVAPPDSGMGEPSAAS